METSLKESGLDCVVRDAWSDFWSRNLFLSRIPGGYKLFLGLVAPANSWLHSLHICPNDIAWISGPPVPDTTCFFERKVIEQGASYIFWIEDDLFSQENRRATAEARMRLADMTVAVTPALTERIRELFPDKLVITLEEPVDVERLKPVSCVGETERPMIVWGGRPWGSGSLLELSPILERVYRDLPFTLRIVSGKRRPDLTLPIPWEWVPFDRAREAENTAGAVAGLAPLEDTVFNSCKGNYKVKTYMAMGIPPLVSPVGYNHNLVRHGETGFLPNTPDEWEYSLRTLLRDRLTAQRIGEAARAEIIRRYSYKALMPIWAAALKKAFPDRLRCQDSSLATQTYET